MSFFFGGARSQASQTPAVSGLHLQSSAYGKALPLVYGSTRLAPNLIWYGDFISHSHSSSARGGKGAGGGGGGGKGGGSSTSYTYSTAVALGLCEGPINRSRGSIATLMLLASALGGVVVAVVSWWLGHYF